MKENLEKIEIAMNELTRRHLLERGATEEQVKELLGGAEVLTKIALETVFSDKKIECETLKEMIKKVLSEDPQVMETRMLSLIMTCFLLAKKSPLQQIKFCDKLLQATELQLTGISLKKMAEEKLREAIDFSKGF